MCWAVATGTVCDRTRHERELDDRLDPGRQDSIVQCIKQREAAAGGRETASSGTARHDVRDELYPYMRLDIGPKGGLSIVP